MLTKEECEKALKIIEDGTVEIEDYNSIPRGICNPFENEFSLLKQLIHEHFDNPPLSFDDLKEGMWVWDDFWKKYRYIFCLNKEVQNSIGFDMWAIDWVDFEENRFYRRQKED